MKHKAIKIEIGFSESPHIQRNKSPVFRTMAAANTFFSAQNFDAERNRESGKLLGYYKTDFKITFENGQEYNGRYDIGSDDPDLTSHIRRFAECYSGRVKPSHLTDAQWAALLKTHLSNRENFYVKLLDEYDLDS